MGEKTLSSNLMGCYNVYIFVCMRILIIMQWFLFLLFLVEHQYNYLYLCVLKIFTSVEVWPSPFLLSLPLPKIKIRKVISIYYLYSAKLDQQPTPLVEYSYYLLYCE